MHDAHTQKILPFTWLTTRSVFVQHQHVNNTKIHAMEVIIRGYADTRKVYWYHLNNLTMENPHGYHGVLISFISFTEGVDYEPKWYSCRSTWGRSLRHKCWIGSIVVLSAHPHQQLPTDPFMLVPTAWDTGRKLFPITYITVTCSGMSWRPWQSYQVGWSQSFDYPLPTSQDSCPRLSSTSLKITEGGGILHHTWRTMWHWWTKYDCVLWSTCAFGIPASHNWLDWRLMQVFAQEFGLSWSQSQQSCKSMDGMVEECSRWASCTMAASTWLYRQVCLCHFEPWPVAQNFPQWSFQSWWTKAFCVCIFTWQKSWKGRQ